MGWLFLYPARPQAWAAGLSAAPTWALRGCHACHGQPRKQPHVARLQLGLLPPPPNGPLLCFTPAVSKPDVLSS